MFKSSKNSMAKHRTNLQLLWLAVVVIGSWRGQHSWQLLWLAVGGVIVVGVVDIVGVVGIVCKVGS